MRDPNPVVYLVPGVGMITFAKDKATARIAAEFYVNAINVMRGATAVSRYRGPAPSRRPSTSSTGCSRKPSCSGCRSRSRLTGKHRAGHRRRRRHRPGHRRAADRARAPASSSPISTMALVAEVETEIAERVSPDVVRGVHRSMSPARTAVADGFAAAARHYGGLDILVSNAGISSAAPVEDTSLDLWGATSTFSPPATSWFRAKRSG
jgi:hypothetical protein